MDIDLYMIDLVHSVLSDRSIFDNEIVWLCVAFFIALASEKVTNRIPKRLMKVLSILTLKRKNSKTIDK